MGFSVFHRLNSIGPLAQIIGRDRAFLVLPQLGVIFDRPPGGSPI